MRKRKESNPNPAEAHATADIGKTLRNCGTGSVLGA